MMCRRRIVETSVVRKTLCLHVVTARLGRPGFGSSRGEVQIAVAGAVAVASDVESADADGTGAAASRVRAAATCFR